MQKRGVGQNKAEHGAQMQRRQSNLWSEHVSDPID